MTGKAPEPGASDLTMYAVALATTLVLAIWLVSLRSPEFPNSILLARDPRNSKQPAQVKSQQKSPCLVVLGARTGEVQVSQDSVGLGRHGVVLFIMSENFLYHGSPSLDPLR